MCLGIRLNQAARSRTGPKPAATLQRLAPPPQRAAPLTSCLRHALNLQRPLPDGTLRIVARGDKENPAGEVIE
jgi:hypothetical protein